MSTTTEEVATTMVADANAPSIVTNAIVQTVQSIISSTTSKSKTAAATTNVAASGSSTTTPTIPTTTTTLQTPSLSSMKENLSVSDLSSTLQHFGTVDYLVFIAMLAVCAVIGFYFGFIEKKQKKKRGQLSTDEQDGLASGGIEETLDSEALDYLVGGRKMKVLPVSLSLVASFVSGIALLGYSTEIYVYGTQYAFILITLAISGLISWYIFLPVFCNLQLTSTYEYFELRFSKSTRLVASCLFTITTLIWLPIVIYVPALAFNQVTGINVHIITPAVCIVCIFYTTVGGLKAVVWTDVIQTVIMVGAIFFVVIKGTIDVGGVSVVIERNMASGRLEWPEFTFDPKVRMSVFALFIGYTGHATYNVGCNQIITQRLLSLPTVKDMKKATVLFVVGVILLSALTFYNGVLLFATYFDCDPLTTKLAKAKDQLVPLLVMDTMKSFPGMTGVFVAGVFSAALSSLSTALNSLAAVFLEDYIKPLRSKPLTERQTAITMRLCTLIIGTMSVGLVFIVERMGTHVLQLFMSLSSVTQGPLLALFVMGMLMPRLNSKSALAGAFCSFLFMTWVCVNAQLALNSGELHFESKPVSTEGCDYEFERPLITPANATFIATEPSPLSFFQQIYHISFMTYTLFSSLVGIIVGYLSSFIFGRHELKDVDVELLAPCLRRFYRGNYASVQLKESALKSCPPKLTQ
ncbi:sodium-coupled monocarboxylate transporter 1 isoform X2 [Drosophila grimshawi]|uniref:sodium-coupled monocarboxylate transporter 1 isoform X2 n=1 Tax=Drosophila grimshawi TaxID=7222 RepID=UPI000C870A2E|nr:sodium-coupled monocarboxylate transporter 1 isoform X2 [Drosophila grimshawi]